MMEEKIEILWSGFWGGKNERYQWYYKIKFYEQIGNKEKTYLVYFFLVRLKKCFPVTTKKKKQPLLHSIETWDKGYSLMQKQRDRTTVHGSIFIGKVKSIPYLWGAVSYVFWFSGFIVI